MDAHANKPELNAKVTYLESHSELNFAHILAVSPESINFDVPKAFHLSWSIWQHSLYHSI